MTSRQQCVKFNSHIGKCDEFTTGISQDTILEPWLFILYVNDFLTGILDEIILSVANDTVVIATDKYNKVKKMNDCVNIQMVTTK